jgi:hypothetical protein
MRLVRVIHRQMSLRQPDWIHSTIKSQFGAASSWIWFQFAFDERLIDDHLRADVGQFPNGAKIRHMGAKYCGIRYTPTEIASTSEKDFDCFASTGANTLETIFPNASE